MDQRAQIVELTPYAERGANELFNYGAVGVCALLFIVGAVLIIRWAFRKIEESQTRLDALHTFYGEKLDLKERAHTAEIQRTHEEYMRRMESISETVKEALESNTKAMNDMRTEFRIRSESQNQHSGNGPSFKGI